MFIFVVLILVMRRLNLGVSNFIDVKCSINMLMRIYSELNIDPLIYKWCMVYEIRKFYKKVTYTISYYTDI